MVPRRSAKVILGRPIVQKVRNPALMYTVTKAWSDHKMVKRLTCNGKFLWTHRFENYEKFLPVHGQEIDDNSTHEDGESGCNPDVLIEFN